MNQISNRNLFKKEKSGYFGNLKIDLTNVVTQGEPSWYLNSRTESL